MLHLIRPGAANSKITGETMTRCFAVSKGRSLGDIGDSVEAIQAFARAQARYFAPVT